MGDFGCHCIVGHKLLELKYEKSRRRCSLSLCMKVLLKPVFAK